MQVASCGSTTFLPANLEFVYLAHKPSSHCTTTDVAHGTYEEFFAQDRTTSNHSKPEQHTSLKEDLVEYLIDDVWTELLNSGELDALAQRALDEALESITTSTVEVAKSTPRKLIHPALNQIEMISAEDLMSSLTIKPIPLQPRDIAMSQILIVPSKPAITIMTSQSPAIGQLPALSRPDSARPGSRMTQQRPTSARPMTARISNQGIYGSGLLSRRQSNFSSPASRLGTIGTWGSTGSGVKSESSQISDFMQVTA